MAISVGFMKVKQLLPGDLFSIDLFYERRRIAFYSTSNLTGLAFWHYINDNYKFLVITNTAQGTSDLEKRNVFVLASMGEAGWINGDRVCIKHYFLIGEDGTGDASLTNGSCCAYGSSASGGTGP